MSSKYFTSVILIAQLFFMWPSKRYFLNFKNIICILIYVLVGRFALQLFIKISYFAAQKNVYSTFYVNSIFGLNMFRIFLLYFKPIYFFFRRSELKSLIHQLERISPYEKIGDHPYRFLKLILYIAIVFVDIWYLNYKKSGFEYFEILAYEFEIWMHVIKLYLIAAILSIFRKYFFILNIKIADLQNVFFMHNNHHFHMILELVESHFVNINVLNIFNNIFSPILLFYSAYVLFGTTFGAFYTAIHLNPSSLQKIKVRFSDIWKYNWIFINVFVIVSILKHLRGLEREVRVFLQEAGFDTNK